MNDGLVVHPITLEADALLALHAAFPDRYPALFESAASGTVVGRFDILFGAPGATLTLRPDGTLAGDAPIDMSTDARWTFLDALDRWWQQEARADLPAALPFTGGWLVFLGYELAQEIEPRLRLPMPASGPIAQAIRVRGAIVRESATGATFIVAETRDIAAQIERDVLAPRPVPAAPARLLRDAIMEDPPEHYLEAVRHALDYIGAGDVYQANLSRTWRASLATGTKPHHLYERLRRTNPGPFCALAMLDGLSVVSSSPERLVEVRNGSIATRPIAGTRPRGADPLRDRDLARELHAHPKERAEHVMLIDLERNDLGRVCEPGSVHVDEFMTIESYAHVHHIVSNVRGRKREGVTPGTVLKAVFPGGTITGCPKVRCMEIIAELEGRPRGAYTGSLGLVNRDGSMDLNILIRSLELRDGALTLRAGAGIVADSIPERELEETRAKARGVLRALAHEATP
jgi:anthranilate synthase component 1